MHDGGLTILALLKMHVRHAEVWLLDRQYLGSGSKRQLRRDGHPHLRHAHSDRAGAFEGSQPPIYPNPYFHFHMSRWVKDGNCSFVLFSSDIFLARDANGEHWFLKYPHMRCVIGAVKMFTAFNSKDFPLGKLHRGNNWTEAKRFMHEDVYYNISLPIAKKIVNALNVQD